MGHIPAVCTAVPLRKSVDSLILTDFLCLSHWHFGTADERQHEFELNRFLRENKSIKTDSRDTELIAAVLFLN